MSKKLNHELASIIKAGLRGDIPVTLAPGEDDWSYGHRDIPYLFGPHKFVIFNDDGDIDYLDSVTLADGRHFEYEDLHPNVLSYSTWLSVEELDALLTLLRSIPRSEAV